MNGILQAASPYSLLILVVLIFVIIPIWGYFDNRRNRREQTWDDEVQQFHKDDASRKRR